MSLLTSFLPKKETINYFIVLGLEENHVRAAVAEMLGDKVKILGTGKSEFSDPAKETEAVDIAVSMAEKQISEDLLVENVIFALPQFYLEGDNVKPEYLARLKKIAKELELKAYGFVEYATAITNYLTMIEGSPPTVLLLDLSKSHMTTTLVRIGKIISNVTVERTQTLVADFSIGITQFDTEILPSRIIIFDIARNNDDIKEELLKFPWHKHSVFLHTPKMEVFDNEKILKAVVEAAASSFLPNIKETMDMSQTEEVVEVTPEVKEEAVSHETVETYEENIEEKSIHEELHQKEEKKGKQNKFGFAEESLLDDKAVMLESPLPRETRPVNRPTNDVGAKFSGILAGITNIYNADKFKNVLLKNLPAMPNIPFKGIFLLIPLLVLAYFGYTFIINYPTATVYLLTYPAKNDTNINVVFAKDDSKNTDGVQTKTVTDAANGSKTAKTTGTNQIGEKAKGEVTVYNKNTSGKNITKGTTIASGPLKFTLDEDVKIASASESTEGITFGKTSVKVTAASIGPESNLPANSNFTFTDSQYSVLTAKNNLPFSGGTSRDITAVSKEDRDNLENDLIKELVNSAKSKMMKKIDPGYKLLDEPINTVVSAKKFSHDVGTEAKDITLEMTLKVEGLSYNPKDLESKASVLSAQAPSGYTLDPTKVNVKVAESKTNKSGDIEAKVIITSYFLPVFDLNSIKEEIKGKTYNQTTDLLQKHSEIAGARIVPENQLPFFNNKLPDLSKNINLIVTSK